MTAGRGIRFATWNVHRCTGPDGRRDPGRVARALAGLGADVVALQECDERFGQRRALLDPVEVERVSGLRLVRCSEDGARAHGWRGNLLLVSQRVEVASVERMALPSLEPRGAVIWRLSTGGTQVTVAGFHLSLISSWRRLQAEAIAARLARGDGPAVALGDTNDWRPGSRALKALEDLMGARSVGGASFPSRMPVLALDRVVAGRGAVVSSWAVAGTAASRAASDHLPLVADVSANC